MEKFYNFILIIDTFLLHYKLVGILVYKYEPHNKLFIFYSSIS